VPDSICYTADNEGRYTFRQVSIWLFRHQIWVETGEWIGNHKAVLSPLDYFLVANPASHCRCGTKKTYSTCCVRNNAEATVK